jgi:hypothetical protein
MKKSILFLLSLALSSNISAKETDFSVYLPSPSKQDKSIENDNQGFDKNALNNEIKQIDVSSIFWENNGTKETKFSINGTSANRDMTMSGFLTQTLQKKSKYVVIESIIKAKANVKDEDGKRYEFDMTEGVSDFFDNGRLMKFERLSGISCVPVNEDELQFIPRVVATGEKGFLGSYFCADTGTKVQVSWDVGVDNRLNINRILKRDGSSSNETMSYAFDENNNIIKVDFIAQGGGDFLKFTGVKTSDLF